VKASVWVRMDTWVRHLIPATATLFLLLLTVVPLRLPAVAEIAPMLPLMGVYYWAIYRPDLLPAWLAFTIGLLADVIAGTPLGVEALVLLLVQGTAARQRRFFLGKSFAVTWWSFGLLAAGATTLDWLLVSLLNGRAIDPSPVLISYLLTLGCFPLLTWALARTQMAFLIEV